MRTPLATTTLVAVALFALAGCSSESSGDADKHVWSGHREVAGRVYLGHNVRKPEDPAEFFYGGNGIKNMPTLGGACAGGHPLLSDDPDDEYDHIIEGAAVELVSSTGKVVATGRLGPGTIESAPGAGTGCVFRFSIPTVSGDSTSLKARVKGYDLTVPVTSTNASEVHLDFP